MSSTDSAFFNRLAINHNGLVFYHSDALFSRFSGSSFYRINAKTGLIELKEKKEIAPGVQSSSSTESQAPLMFKLNKKKVSRKLVALFHSKLCAKTLNFFTITFPLSTSDDESFRLLNSVLTRLRRGYEASSIAKILLDRFSSGYSDKMKRRLNLLIELQEHQQLNHYLWVAERQLNGTIHFHLVTPDIIDVLIFNYFVAEYIDNTLKQTSQNPKIQSFLIDKYNGVDVTRNFAFRNDKQLLRKYLTKYVTKNNSYFSHRCFHCSRSISALFTTMHEDVAETDLQHLVDVLPSKVAFRFESPYFSFIAIPDIHYSIAFAEMITINDEIIDLLDSS